MLTQRIASAAVGVPIIVLLIIVGGWPYVAVVAAALAVAAVEFQHFKHGWYSLATGLAALATAFTVIAARYGFSTLDVALLTIFLAVALVRMAASVFDRDGESFNWKWVFIGYLYVAFLGSFIVLLREGDDGRDWVFLALLTTYAVDTAAYFTGRAVGRHKLAPLISPNKTIEGFIGGWAAGFAAAIALNYALGLRIEAWQIGLLGLLLPLAAAAGDLLESAIKRYVEIKDASELIPGHGGVLDRLDSVLFTFALTWAFRALI